MGNIADFSRKPFSSRVQTRLQTYQVIATVFSTNLAGFDHLTKKLVKQGLGHQDKGLNWSLWSPWGPGPRQE